MPEQNLKKVRFPIERTVVFGGKEKRERIDREQTLKCWSCGILFHVREKNCFYLKPNRKHVPDEGPYICCPECRKWTHCLYYLDNPYKPKVRLPKPKRKEGSIYRFYESSLDYEY